MQNCLVALLYVQRQCVHRIKLPQKGKIGEENVTGDNNNNNTEGCQSLAQLTMSFKFARGYCDGMVESFERFLRVPCRVPEPIKKKITDDKG